MPSRKGSPNKSTNRAKRAIAKFVEMNIGKFGEWMDEIYKEEGAKSAMEITLKVMEYYMPKLARTEWTGKDGGELTVTLETILKEVDQREALPGSKEAIDGECEKV